jgi:beta-1,4-galactosyltransferase 1
MLAVIIPYRKRANHLALFSKHMRAYLAGLPHYFLLVEQADSKPFNRGKLLNIGASLAIDASYIALHDVDMLPQNASYAPVNCPTHMATQAQQFGYKMPYPTYFGGVTLFPREDFMRINGFSNDFWGWGAEDDDLLARCKSEGLAVASRPGRFTCLDHAPAPRGSTHLYNLERLRRVAGTEAYKKEGINSLEYTVLASFEDADFCYYQVTL